MRTVVAQVRAAWYGAAAGSVGVGGAGKPTKTGVNCKGLVNKAVAEAQRMVDEFKGNGVWGQLAPDEDANAWVPFGYSGMQPADDADGWDDAVAVRLAKKECEHVATIDLTVAEQLGVTARGTWRGAAAPPLAHQGDPDRRRARRTCSRSPTEKSPAPS
eukprot:COSAG06_NODE_4029_length_4643_cov_7.802597_3_plen_159_part_00